MNISLEIRGKLLNDRDFRLKTAIALGVTENNVRKLSKDNSENLTKYPAIKFFKSVGYKESELFETEP